MKEYFGIKCEFDHEVVDLNIQSHIERNLPGYVCSMDWGNFNRAIKDPNHLNVLNSSIVNNCDSSWVPIVINHLYKTNYTNYCGNTLFIDYIKKRQYKQFFLGSTQEILEGLKKELSKLDPAIASMRFETLPFRKVEEFDYEGIAKMINEDAPDIIWVSLGAPKQENFMYRLQPLLKRGIMFGFGAIFTWYSNTSSTPKRSPQWMVKLKLEWFYRLLTEPNMRKKWKKESPLPDKFFLKAYIEERNMRDNRLNL